MALIVQSARKGSHLRKNFGYPFKCEVCKERFKQINYLNKHAWKHKKIEIPFICNHCGKEFQRKNHLGSHWKMVKDKLLGKDCFGRKNLTKKNI